MLYQATKRPGGTISAYYSSKRSLCEKAVYCIIQSLFILISLPLCPWQPLSVVVEPCVPTVAVGLPQNVI